MRRFCGQVFAQPSRRGVAFGVAVHANVDAWDRSINGVRLDATPGDRVRIQSVGAWHVLEASSPQHLEHAMGNRGVASFQASQLPSISGVESRWSCCAECNAPPIRRCENLSTFSTPHHATGFEDTLSAVAHSLYRHPRNVDLASGARSTTRRRRRRKDEHEGGTDFTTLRGQADSAPGSRIRCNLVVLF